MSYVNTVASHTKAASRAIGDPVWIRRRGTLEEGLGWAWVAPLITSLTSLGTAAYSIKTARDDSKDAKRQADRDASAAAASEAAARAETKRLNDANIALIEAQRMKTLGISPPKLDAQGNVVVQAGVGAPPVMVAGALAVFGGGAFLLWKMTGKPKRRR